jgi:hypothetical protein
LDQSEPLRETETAWSTRGIFGYLPKAKQEGDGLGGEVEQLTGRHI